MPIDIEDDAKKLAKLDRLLSEYWNYIYARENQPLGAQMVALVGGWVRDNIRSLNASRTDRPH